VKPKVNLVSRLEEFVRKPRAARAADDHPVPPKGRVHFLVPPAFVPELHEIAERGIELARVHPPNPGDRHQSFRPRIQVACADGTSGVAAKVLLATGLVDELPELAGIEKMYGISVHHCLYCDGYEYAGKQVAPTAKATRAPISRS
jgi:hypothetical protein